MPAEQGGGDVRFELALKEAGEEGDGGHALEIAGNGAFVASAGFEVFAGDVGDAAQGFFLQIADGRIVLHVVGHAFVDHWIGAFSCERAGEPLAWGERLYYAKARLRRGPKHLIVVIQLHACQALSGPLPKTTLRIAHYRSLAHSASIFGAVEGPRGIE